MENKGVLENPFLKSFSSPIFGVFTVTVNIQTYKSSYKERIELPHTPKFIMSYNYDNLWCFILPVKDLHF